MLAVTLDRHDTPAEQRAADLGRGIREHDGVGRARDPGDAPPERDARGEAARGVDLGQLRHATSAYFTISSSSTSNTSVEPGLILAAPPRSP